MTILVIAFPKQPMNGNIMQAPSRNENKNARLIETFFRFCSLHKNNIVIYKPRERVLQTVRKI